MVEKTEGSRNDTVILIVIVLIIAVVILFITGGFGFLTKSSMISTGPSETGASGTLQKVNIGGEVYSGKFTEGKAYITDMGECFVYIDKTAGTRECTPDEKAETTLSSWPGQN